jgi:hypothetical protein
MEHRRLQILFAIISLFAFGVIVWYFLFSKPSEAPTLTGTANPLSVTDLPARLGFIFKSNPPETTTETEVTDPTKEAFIKIWDKPSTGNTFATRPILKEVTASTTVGTSTILVTKSVRATTTLLMFVDRTTGYIYGHNVESGATYQISNSTIPGVHDAYIWSGGDRVLMRYLNADRKTIVSVLGTIPNIQEGHDAQPLLNITTLPNNISSVAVSASGNAISYIVPNDNGASIYTITSKGTSHVADSPFTEWTLSYGGEQLYATTKPSAYVEGTTVLLPSFGRIIGEKTGLTSSPSSGGVLLHSMWAQSGLSTFATKGPSLVQFSVRTLAPKCAGGAAQSFICGVPKSLPSGDEGLPDDWYQGRVSFDDTLMLLDANNGTAYSLYSFDQKYGPMDVTSVRTSSKADLISFIQKQGGGLYLLNTNLLSNGSVE